MKVAHISLTPLAGSPIRIVQALNKHTGTDARLITLNTAAYGDRIFDNDLDWKTDMEESIEWLRIADVLHFHHYFPMARNPFKIDFDDKCFSQARVWQFHNHPKAAALGDAKVQQEIMLSSRPKFVVAQHQERFYPNAFVVPNIVPINEPLYLPAMRRTFGAYFAVGHGPLDQSAWDVRPDRTRWETKGAPEIHAIFKRVSKRGGLECCYDVNVPHTLCLERRRTFSLSIDDVVTGSYHLSGLEGLSAGCATLCTADHRSLTVLREMTGAPTVPFIHCPLEHLEWWLGSITDHQDKLKDIGTMSRHWMEEYYNDADMIQHYIKGYRKLLEGPEHLSRQENLKFRCASDAWLAIDHQDIIWDSRANQCSIIRPLRNTVGTKNLITQIANILLRR